MDESADGRLQVLSDAEDPLASSVLAGGGGGGDGVSEIAPEDQLFTPGSLGMDPKQQQQQAAMTAALTAQLDSSIGLSLTTTGIRKLLGRKPAGRPKPLINIVCKGCGRGSHDADEFVESDFTELLGWTVVRDFVWISYGRSMWMFP